jgi:hypothetical protein
MANTPFNGEYDKAMFRKALALVERTSAPIRIMRLMSLVFAIGILIVGAPRWFASGFNAPDMARIARDLITAALLGYFFISPMISRWQSVSKVFKKDERRKMAGYADKDGITIQTPPGKEGFFAWEKFIRKGSRDQLTALMLYDGALAVFQRDFFKNESDWNRFNQLVNQKVKELRLDK